MSGDGSISLNERLSAMEHDISAIKSTVEALRRDYAKMSGGFTVATVIGNVVIMFCGVAIGAVMTHFPWGK